MTGLFDDISKQIQRIIALKSLSCVEWNTMVNPICWTTTMPLATPGIWTPPNHYRIKYRLRRPLDYPIVEYRQMGRIGKTTACPRLSSGAFGGQTRA
jgi:hypothetical protein